MLRSMGREQVEVSFAEQDDVFREMIRTLGNMRLSATREANILCATLAGRNFEEVKHCLWSLYKKFESSRNYRYQVEVQKLMEMLLG